ncbi:phosphoribosylanthranilate isomerase [Clostridium sp.]
MTKIKICGITRLIDIEYLNELQPEYAGFVFAKSIRKVDVSQAINLIVNLSKNIKSVGVFVDEEPEVVLEIADKLKLQVLQFHGHENQEYINKFKGYEIWKAFKISSIKSIGGISNYNCSKYLLDNTIAGSGKSFKWELAEKSIEGSSIILAGGLNIANVQKGISKLKPYGVDVSTGVETQGYKDYEKIREFIMKVREL